MSEIQDAGNAPRKDYEDLQTRPASQALLDLEASGLTPEDLAAAARPAAEETDKARPPAPRPPALLLFHWLTLLFLSAAGALALAWSGEMTGRLEELRLWAIAGLTLLLLLMSALPSARFCPRLPTRGGLAAALFSAAFLIQTLKGHPETYFQVCPAPLAWAGLLTLAILWTIIAAIRKLNRTNAALVSLFLLYAAAGPITALAGHLDGPELTWTALSASPAFLTGLLPWFLWPMTLALGLGLPLAAILSLGDQWSSLRRPGARHAGSFFLALGWLGLFFSGLLLFSPAAESQMVKKLRDMAPVLAGVEPAPSAGQAVIIRPAPQPAGPGTTASPLPIPEPPPPPARNEQDEEALAARISELERRLENLENRLRGLNGQLMETPAEPEPAAPGQPLPPPPAENDDPYYSNGSAT